MLCAGRTSEITSRLKCLYFDQLRAGEVTFGRTWFPRPAADGPDLRTIWLMLPTPASVHRQIYLYWSQECQAFEGGFFRCFRSGSMSEIRLTADEIQLVSDSYSLAQYSRDIYSPNADREQAESGHNPKECKQQIGVTK